MFAIRDMPGSERPGEYVNDHVQFAFASWQASRKQALEEAINACRAEAEQNKRMFPGDPSCEIAATECADAIEELLK